MDKNKILSLAKKYGFNILESIVVEKVDIPKNLDYPIRKGIKKSTY